MSKSQGASNRRRGRDYEAEIRRYIGQFFEIINSNQSGYEGDDWRLPAFDWLSGETKLRREDRLGSWVDQAKKNAKGLIGVVIHKRWGKGNPADAFVTMRLEDFLTILEIIKSLGTEAEKKK